MNDDQELASAIRSAGVEPTPEARAEIRSALVAEMRGEASILPSQVTQGGRRRTWLVVAAVATAAALVGVVSVLTSDEDTSRVVPADTVSPATELSTASQSLLLDELVGARWIVVEEHGRPWRYSFVPHVEFRADASGGATDLVIHGDDSCDSISGNGSLDGDRLRVQMEVDSERHSCGSGPGRAAPQDGDRVVLSADGMTLRLTNDEGFTRYVYRRIDALEQASDGTLTGRWTFVPAGVSVDPPGERFTLDLSDDGTGAYGPCGGWSWTMTSTLAVSGWPEPRYMCFGVAVDVMSARLEYMLTNGPVDARLSSRGTALYLADDRYVITLTKR